MLSIISIILCVISLVLTIQKKWYGFLFGIVGNAGLMIVNWNNDLFTVITLAIYSLFCIYGAYSWYYENNS